MSKRLAAAAFIVASATVGLVQPASADDDVEVKVKVNNVRVCNNDCVDL